jgi:hypothetical protein
MDCIFGDVDLAAIERASISGRGILNLVKDYADGQFVRGRPRWGGCIPGITGTEDRPLVSKRLDSLYRSGRSPHWVKVKNPKAPAVKRKAEEDWGSPHWIRSKSRSRQP